MPPPESLPYDVTEYQENPNMRRALAPPSAEYMKSHPRGPPELPTWVIPTTTILAVAFMTLLTLFIIVPILRSVARRWRARRTARKEKKLREMDMKMERLHAATAEANERRHMQLMTELSRSTNPLPVPYPNLPLPQLPPTAPPTEPIPHLKTTTLCQKTPFIKPAKPTPAEEHMPTLPQLPSTIQVNNQHTINVNNVVYETEEPTTYSNMLQLPQRKPRAFNPSSSTGH